MERTTGINGLRGTAGMEGCYVDSPLHVTYNILATFNALREYYLSIHFLFLRL